MKAMTHTSTEQPEALRLAKELRYCKVMFIPEVASDFESAAALLERLNARVQELEASQAQRVPLTDEEKQNLLKEWSYSQFTGNGDFLDGVEAAERAHGITQEKQG